MVGPIIANVTQIDGQELRLVPTEERHLSSALRMINDPEITRYLGVGLYGVTGRGEEKWYQHAIEDHSSIIWSIVLVNAEGVETHIGQTGLHDINWQLRTAVTGIIIDRPYWGKGVASAVMARRAKYAFEVANLEALFTEIFTPNIGSRKAAERVGYVQYGLKPFAKYAEGQYLEAWLGVLSRARFSEPTD